MVPIKIYKLSKEYILSQVTELSIFSFYFGVSESDIENCIHFKSTVISSVRHNDSHPSMGFYVAGNHMIYAQDFGGSFHGDCFDAVAYMRPNLNCSFPLKSNDFMKVLEEIKKDLITNYAQPITRSPTSENLVKLTPNFDPYLREWNKSDLNFWNDIHINLETLTEFNTWPLEELWVNDRLVYTYRRNDPAYLYIFAPEVYQVYFPYRDRHFQNKFMSNKFIIQGGRRIKPSPIGVITKSYKDVMFMSNYEHLGIQAIAPPGERYIFNDEQMNFIRQNWGIVYTLSDFDRTGILFGLRMKRKHNTIPLWLTNGYFGTINFGAKDPTDYVKIHSKRNFDYLVECIYKDVIITDYDKFSNQVLINLGHLRKTDLDQSIPYL